MKDWRESGANLDPSLFSAPGGPVDAGTSTAQSQFDISRLKQRPADRPESSGFGCSGSEMGHHYATNGVSIATPGDFSNIRSNYWSGTEYSPETSKAWNFEFLVGTQGPVFAKTSQSRTAWAVRDGDVDVGDLNNDGNVDVADLLLLQQILTNPTP